jgi:hypothetical protein
MSCSHAAQITTIFVSAVESSRDAGRPIDSSHHRQNMQSHTRRPWVTRSLRPTTTNTLQEP